METSKAFDNILDWKKHIRDIPHDFLVMDKLLTKKTEVTIETWESICDVVESIIKDGDVTWKCRWMAAETLLSFMELPSLDPIDQTLPPKLKLNEIEWNFTTAKQQIQGVNQITL